MRVRADAGADRSAAQRAAEPRTRRELGTRGRELARFTERAQHAIELPARRAGGWTDDRSDEQSLAGPTFRRGPRRKKARATNASLTCRGECRAQRLGIRLGNSRLAQMPPTGVRPPI